MIKIIESESNKLIKLVKSLKIKKYRDNEGLFIAEGLRLVKDGIKVQNPYAVIVSDSFLSKNELDFKCDIFKIPDKLFEKISDTNSPQGIMGVFNTSYRNASEISAGENIIALNNVSDPGNIGTIIRTATATGFKSILLDKGCADIYNPKTVRSTMSGIFKHKFYISDDFYNDCKELKSKGYSIICSALLNDSVSLYKADLEEPFVMLFGNEANGVSSDLINISDISIKIPMEPDIESLNVGVAASLFMYEHYRKKLS